MSVLREATLLHLLKVKLAAPATLSRLEISREQLAALMQVAASPVRLLGRPMAPRKGLARAVACRDLRLAFPRLLCQTTAQVYLDPPRVSLRGLLPHLLVKLLAQVPRDPEAIALPSPQVHSLGTTAKHLAGVRRVLHRVAIRSPLAFHPAGLRVAVIAEN